MNKWVFRERKSKFIAKFPSQIPNGEWCPGFWYAKPMLGCSHACRTCFMHRIRLATGKPNTIYINSCDLHQEVWRWLDKTPSHDVLCFGTETGDIIADRELFKQAWKQYPEDFIVPLFTIKKKHDILFLTKGDNVEWFLSHEPNPWTIVSFSINGIKSALSWERNTPPMENRLKAIDQLLTLGWRVRVRVDPLIVDLPDWEEDITPVASWINERNIETITSGVLRFKKVPTCSVQEQIDKIGFFKELLTKQKQERFMTCKTHLPVLSALHIKSHICNCMPLKQHSEPFAVQARLL